MGAAASQCSCISVNDSDEVRTSKSIDHSLRETRRQRDNTPKILLLGSGESGKSTVLKQMRLINNIPFTENEREAYRVQIFYNLANGMRSLLDALRDLPPLETEEASQATQNPIHQVPVHSHALHHHRAGMVSHNPPPPVFPNTNVKPRKPLFGPVPPLSPSPTPPESTDSLATDEADRESNLRRSVVKEEILPSPSPAEAVNEQDTKEDEEPRSRSPSISLNLFASGSLTPRQLSLLHELNYPPDLRPGQPFPIEFEAILRECWWGLTPDEYEALLDQHRRQGTSSEMKLTPKLPGAGAQLDRIAVESGVAIPDNLPYLFSSPQRLSSFFHPDYMPTDEDILRCRGRTTGIQETIFQIGKDLGGAVKASAASSAAGSSKNNSQLQPLKIAVGKTKLHLVDVGGQKSERRKWIHCFEGVTAVLFLVGLSGYNQGLIEDSTANQMQDAMSLWDGVCSSQWFKNTALILFLNKTDLFAEKVAKFPIRTWFTDFDGEPEDVEAGLNYFRRRFLRIAVKATRNMTNAAEKGKKSGTHEPLSSRTKSKTKSGTFSSPLDSRDITRKRSSQRADSSPTATMGTAGTTTISSSGQATLTPSTVPTSSSSPRPKDKGKGRAMGEALEMGERPSPTAHSSRSRSGVDERERKESARTARPRRDSVGRSAMLDSTGRRSAPKDKFIGLSSLPKNPTGGYAVGKGRFVYTHFTNATDTDHLRIVIVAVCDIILRDNFATAHLI